MQMNFDLFCVAIVKNLPNWFMKPDQPQAAGGPASAHVHRVKFLPIINLISTFGVCVCVSASLWPVYIYNPLWFGSSLAMWS